MASSSGHQLYGQKYAVFSIPHAHESIFISNSFFLEIPYLTQEKSSRLRACSASLTISNAEMFPTQLKQTKQTKTKIVYFKIHMLKLHKQIYQIQTSLGRTGSTN